LQYNKTHRPPDSARHAAHIGPQAPRLTEHAKTHGAPHTLHHTAHATRHAQARPTRHNAGNTPTRRPNHNKLPEDVTSPAQGRRSPPHSSTRNPQLPKPPRAPYHSPRFPVNPVSVRLPNRSAPQGRGNPLGSWAPKRRSAGQPPPLPFFTGGGVLPPPEGMNTPVASATPPECEWGRARAMRHWQWGAWNPRRPRLPSSLLFLGLWPAVGWHGMVWYGGGGGGGAACLFGPAIPL
jgi:hypothetical protein